MLLKKIVLILIIVVLAINIISPIMANATNSVGVNDGSIIVSNGQVTLKGPQNINNANDAKATIITKYKALITFFGGILTVTMVAVFIIQFLKLGMITSNPRDRREVLIGLLISGLSAAILGSITFYVGIFYGLFR